MAGSLVLLTVHGIGFQTPPGPDGQGGYADGLHESLRTALGAQLGDDPCRPGAGPVYVQSEVDGSRERGLARLDPDVRLVEQPGQVAHVALVYCPSEGTGPQTGAVADTLARTVLAHHHYASALTTMRMLLADAWAALHAPPAPPDAPPGLRPRSGETGPLAILHALEEDVATYVARNDLRERVRGFVQSALLALLDRPDVAGVFVNAHSQGTVVCWDVLCRLPLSSWRGEPGGGGPDRRWPLLRAFVTAGSPIRKYVDPFSWGERVGQMAALLDRADPPFAWRNVWDPHDPVADPLDPAAAWRPGEPLDAHRDADAGLLVAVGPDGATSHMPVEDVQVDNVGEDRVHEALRAHDYWSNAAQVVPLLAELLSSER